MLVVLISALLSSLPRELTSFALAGQIEISAQNHNFAVDSSTVPEGVEITHVNLNDGTCAGMVFAEKQVQ